MQNSRKLRYCTYFVLFLLFTATNLEADEVEIELVNVTGDSTFQSGDIQFTYWDGSIHQIPFSSTFDPSTHQGTFLSPGNSNFPPIDVSILARPMSPEGWCDPQSGVCYDPLGAGTKGEEGRNIFIGVCLIGAVGLYGSCQISCGDRGVLRNEIGIGCGLPHSCMCNPPPPPPPPPEPPPPPTPPPPSPEPCDGIWMSCNPWDSFAPFIIDDWHFSSQ